jgi:undecaprenyl pyrophosphate phosphatase UppP
MRLASNVASLCAALLLIGLVGAAFTWWGRSALFDLASNSLETVKIGTGFLVGPALILILLPLVFGLPRQLARARFYRARLVAASLLWAAGLWALAARLATLDSSYSVEPGAYISAGLMLVGLVSTLAMWPGRLELVEVNRNGTVRDPMAASAPRERSPTGP